MLTKEKETTKLDPRIKRTRQLLMQAFAELMKEKRFQSITVQDIAERATVNRATFYAHFDDKYALLDYTIRESFRQQLATQMPNQTRYSSENLRLLMLTLCEFMDAFHSHCMPADQQILLLMETNITGALYNVLLAWLKDNGVGRHSRGVPLEVAAVVTSWAMYGAAFQWSREKRPKSANEFVGLVFPMILSGLSQSSSSPLP